MKNDRKKRFWPPIIIMIFLFGMVGCNNPKSNISYDNKSHASTVQEEKLNDKLKGLFLPNEVIMSMSVTHSLKSLQSDKIVGTIRFNDDRYYSITPVADNKYLFLLFSDDLEPYVVDGFLVSTLADKADFKDIAEGWDREEILKRDPSSCIFENYSYHRFSDKSILRIKYDVNDNRYLVSELAYYKSPQSVLNYLIDQDLELITHS